MAKIFKYLFLFFFGGISYIIIELLWRGKSHASMFMLGGLCFVALGLINEKCPSCVPLTVQMLIGTFIITVLEFVFGCVLNLYFHLNIWDYSNLPFNLLGQICVPYMILWFFLSPVAIIVDDYIRYMFFDEEKPHYRLI